MQIEGRNAVFELLKTGNRIEKLMIEQQPQGSLNKIFNEARALGVKVQFVDKRALDRQSETGHHQGVIAVVGDYHYASMDELLASQKSEKGKFVIVCDGIEDVHNLGSILRVAECAGADGVIIPANKSASVTSAVVRISEGAANHLHVVKVGSLTNTVEQLKEAGFWLYALDAGGSDIYSTDLSGNIALVIGGEDSGVRRIIREKCDYTVSLPLLGKVNSLNASVALGIAAYEVVRRRRS